MELGLTGKNVLISGSSGGLGFAIAEGFLSEGVNVLLTGRNKEALNSAKSTLSAKHPNIVCYDFCAIIRDQYTSISLSCTNTYDSITPTSGTQTQRKERRLDEPALLINYCWIVV